MGRLLITACFVAALASGGASGASEALFRQRPAIDLRVFACAPNPTHRVFSSLSEVEDALKVLAHHCDASRFRELRAAFLASVDRLAIRWAVESLVVVQDWYGTGMAKASLELVSQAPDTVKATIRWSVPPPPVTPDTAVCRFAFTVLRQRVSTVEVAGRISEVTVLRIPR